MILRVKNYLIFLELNIINLFIIFNKFWNLFKKSFIFIEKNFQNIMFSRYFVKSLQFSMKKLSFISYDFKKSFRVIPTKLIYLPITMVGSFLFYSLHRNYSVFSTGNTLKFKLEGFNNMQDGEMRPFKYGHKDHETILIVKYNGKFHALSNSCPHFGAPLHTGNKIT